MQPLITGPQIRAAQSLLQWTIADLANITNISRPTIIKARNGHIDALKVKTLVAIQLALEEGGVEFFEGGARLVESKRGHPMKQ